MVPDFRAMKTIQLLALTTVTAIPAFASAATYDIDPAHTRVEFAVKHMMVSTVRGDFTKVSGPVTLDDKDLRKSSVHATIEAASITTGVDKRDALLRSPDFFDVAKFPTLTFNSSSVARVADGKYKVAGELTMHGVTKPIVLEVDAPATEVKDMMGTWKRGATATATLNRKDFGLNWNKALESGGVLVSDTVNVTIELELNRKELSATAVH